MQAIPDTGVRFVFPGARPGGPGWGAEPEADWGTLGVGEEARVLRVGVEQAVDDELGPRVVLRRSLQYALATRSMTAGYSSPRPSNTVKASPAASLSTCAVFSSSLTACTTRKLRLAR